MHVDAELCEIAQVGCVERAKLGAACDLHRPARFARTCRPAHWNGPERNEVADLSFEALADERVESNAQLRFALNAREGRANQTANRRLVRGVGERNEFVHRAHLEIDSAEAENGANARGFVESLIEAAHDVEAIVTTQDELRLEHGLESSRSGHLARVERREVGFGRWRMKTDSDRENGTERKSALERSSERSNRGLEHDASR